MYLTRNTGVSLVLSTVSSVPSLSLESLQEEFEHVLVEPVEAASSGRAGKIVSSEVNFERNTVSSVTRLLLDI